MGAYIHTTSGIFRVQILSVSLKPSLLVLSKKNVLDCI